MCIGAASDCTDACELVCRTYAAEIAHNVSSLKRKAIVDRALEVGSQSNVLYVVLDRCKIAVQHLPVCGSRAGRKEGGDDFNAALSFTTVLWIGDAFGSQRLVQKTCTDSSQGVMPALFSAGCPTGVGACTAAERERHERQGEGEDRGGCVRKSWSFDRGG